MWIVAQLELFYTALLFFPLLDFRVLEQCPDFSACVPLHVCSVAGCSCRFVLFCFIRALALLSFFSNRRIKIVLLVETFCY
jgi:hypothetical protein